MKRRYKLLLIIIIGIVITILISYQNPDTKVKIMAISDGIGMGMTPYNIVGISFNDYLANYYEKSSNLSTYNKDFMISHLTIDELKEYLEKNTKGRISNVPIKQTINNSNIITISIGVEQFADLSLRTKDFTKYINKYIEDYKFVLANIRTFYDKEIIILGLYPTFNFSKNDTLIVNRKLEQIALTTNSKFLDLLPISLNKKYYLKANSYYMNYEAHQKIYRDILKILK